MQFLTLLGLAGAALAFPQANPNSALCSSVSHRPGGCIAPGQPSAKAFCSSFLGIPVQTAFTTVRGTITSTATSTAVVGTTTVTGPASTSTVVRTTTSTLTTPSTTVVSTTYSTTTFTADGSVVTACLQAPTTNAKLMKRTVPKPVCLRRYGNGAELTSACQCFPISTQTSTITRTGAMTTVTSTTTIGSTVTETSTPVITTTRVSTVTITSATIITQTSSIIATTTVTADPTSTVLPTNFAIVASGGGIDGQYAHAADSDEQITSFGDASAASAFFINQTNNNLIEANGTGVGLIANEGPAGSAPAVFFDSADTIRQFPDIMIPITCAIAPNADDTCLLNCDGPFGSNNNYCGGAWYLSTDDQAPCVNNFDTFAVASST